MATLLAVGFATDERPLAGRAWAAASTLVLVPTLYFTFSRGAWFALAIGLVAFVALHPRRLQALATVVATAPAPAIAVLVASRQEALTGSGAELGKAVHQGHRLALLLVALAVGAAVLSAANAAAERRWSGMRLVQQGIAVVVAAALVAGIGVALARYGSPVSLAQRGWHSFAAPPKKIGTNLNERLFSFSGTRRVPQWRVALGEVERHPWTGTGAGTFEQDWNARRPSSFKVRDAHNLYLEVLAELGPLGLATLVAFLGIPLVALARRGREPIAAAAAAVYVAYLAHAALDWDWEMPAVTLTAIACGGSLVAAAGSGRLRVRVPAAALAGAIGVLALLGLPGNLQLSRGASAARAGDWTAAAAHARSAERWAPWSSAPWQQLGEARLARGEFVAARASFRRAIDRNPADWELWFDLARSSTGQVQRAALAKAAALNPFSPEIAEFRAELAEGWEPLDEVES
jgi:O-antigen ligase